MNLPLALYLVLFAIALVAPLRWALISYLVLSTVDFYSGNSGIGALNAAKGLGIPLLLLWRLRKHAGHDRLTVAPLAWLAFVFYIAIASIWSLFPLSAIKLVGEMLGTFLICMTFLRASKAGILSPSIVVPVTIGALIIGILRTTFMPSYGDETTRFTGFTSAQEYAAFLASLYAVALCSKTIRPAIRIMICALLIAAILLDGSRIWTIGLVTMSLTGLLISETRAWVKIYGIAFLILAGVAFVAESDAIIDVLNNHARSNRVAAAVVAIYQGNERSDGLGTYQFRRGVYERAIAAVEQSSPMQIIFGHGTSNGRILRGSMSEGIGDPNRAVHDEWLRVLYEWGVVGTLLWLLFLGSIIAYAYQGARKQNGSYARPLLAFIPGILGALSTENFLAGAGTAGNIGIVMLVALVSVAYQPVGNRRKFEVRVAQEPSLAVS
jgi:O-antigen ligase